MDHSLKQEALCLSIQKNNKILSKELVIEIIYSNKPILFEVFLIAIRENYVELFEIIQQKYYSCTPRYRYLDIEKIPHDNQ